VANFSTNFIKNFFIAFFLFKHCIEILVFTVFSEIQKEMHIPNGIGFEFTISKKRHEKFIVYYRRNISNWLVIGFLLL
jgi:hypothetical protein